MFKVGGTEVHSHRCCWNMTQHGGASTHKRVAVFEDARRSRTTFRTKPCACVTLKRIMRVTTRRAGTLFGRLNGPTIQRIMDTLSSTPDGAIFRSLAHCGLALTGIEPKITHSVFGAPNTAHPVVNMNVAQVGETYMFPLDATIGKVATVGEMFAVVPSDRPGFGIIHMQPMRPGNRPGIDSRTVLHSWWLARDTTITAIDTRDQLGHVRLGIVVAYETPSEAHMVACHNTRNTETAHISHIVALHDVAHVYFPIGFWLTFVHFHDGTVRAWTATTSLGIHTITHTSADDPWSLSEVSGDDMSQRLQDTLYPHQLVLRQLLMRHKFHTFCKVNTSFIAVTTTGLTVFIYLGASLHRTSLAGAMSSVVFRISETALPWHVSENKELVVFETPGRPLVFCTPIWGGVDAQAVHDVVTGMDPGVKVHALKDMRVQERTFVVQWSKDHMYAGRLTVIGHEDAMASMEHLEALTDVQEVFTLRNDTSVDTLLQSSIWVTTSRDAHDGRWVMAHVRNRNFASVAWHDMHNTHRREIMQLMGMPKDTYVRINRATGVMLCK